MGVIESVKGVDDLNSVGNPFAVWVNNKRVSVEKALSVNSGWPYACAKAIAEELGDLSWHLYKKSKSGNTEVDDHEILDILHAPNSFQSGYEIFYKVASHMEFCGQGFWYLVGVKSEKDTPTAIRVLNPRYVKVIEAEFPDFVRGYKYTYKGKVYDFQPYEILHFKYPDPDDDIEGLGTVQGIAPWIDSDNYATEFNRRFFLNGARIGGFLESDAARTPEQMDYLRKSFESIYKGVENAHKIAALPKGTTFKEGTQNQKEMDFIEGQKDSRDKILGGFRVPKTVLGITEDVNRANAEATNYVFALRTIKPKAKLLRMFLNEFFVPRYGADLYLDFDDPVPEDRELEMKELQYGMAGQPIMSVNEARNEYFDLDPISNGDEVMTNFNLSPLGAPIKKAQPKPAGIKGIKTRGYISQKRRSSISEEISKGAVEALKEFSAKAKEITAKAQKDISSLSDDDYKILHKSFISRLTPYEKLQTENVRKFNDKQQKEVLDNLENAVKSMGKKKAINPKSLFDKDQAVGALIDLTGPAMYDLFATEGKEAGKLVGIEDMDVLTPEARKSIDKAVKLMSESYNDTTLAILKDKLETGIEAGLGIDDLKNMVAAIYEFSDEVRATQVARTEVFRIGNDATKEAWKQSDVVKTIKWYTADDEACGFCGPENGKTIDIEGNFYDKGDSVIDADGHTLNLDYDDVGNPPLHVNCRCYIRPETIELAQMPQEIKEEETKEEVLNKKPNIDTEINFEKGLKELEERIDAKIDKQGEVLKNAIKLALSE